MAGMMERETCLTGWHSGKCRANGIDIHYLRSGEDKPPLIALHGLMGSGACLSPLAHTLRNSFDVILPDARGHGGSSADADGYSYAQLADDVVGLIKELRLNAPILLGHSMGGMTAALIGSRAGLTFTAVVLVDPTFIDPDWQREVFESGVGDEHRQSLTLARSDLLAQASVRSPHRPRTMVELLVDAKLRTSVNAFQVLTPPNPDYRELIRNIDVPILLVLGERGIVSLDTARELQSLNPSLGYELILDAGHGLPYDEPERLGVIVESFLRTRCFRG